MAQIKQHQTKMQTLKEKCCPNKIVLNKGSKVKFEHDLRSNNDGGGLLQLLGSKREALSAEHDRSFFLSFSLRAQLRPKNLDDRMLHVKILIAFEQTHSSTQVDSHEKMNEKMNEEVSSSSCFLSLTLGSKHPKRREEGDWDGWSSSNDSNRKHGLMTAATYGDRQCIIHR